MSTMDIFNLAEDMKEFINEDNKEALEFLQDFKVGNYSNVLSKIKVFLENHEVNESLARNLQLLNAVSYSQLGERKKAADIILNIYQDSNEKSIDDLMIYGNVAYMCDYKLARRIMSDAVKRIEKAETFDQMNAARAYLILGQAEEYLEKYIRAIKYFSRSLTYYQREQEQDIHTILFLHFKLGGLHSMINEIDVAIAYLEKTIELAGENNIKELKINSLVSIAKMHGNKNEYEKAFAYLKEAIPMLEGSTLSNKLIHAEAYTEMAYNYFAQSQFDEAIPCYEKAIDIHLHLPHHSERELGMIYMQYAYCLEQKEQPDQMHAERNYEMAIEQLEKTNDQDLVENALADIIAFYDRTRNINKKRFYENKFVKLTNEKAQEPQRKA